VLPIVTGRVRIRPTFRQQKSTTFDRVDLVEHAERDLLAIAKFLVFLSTCFLCIEQVQFFIQFVQRDVSTIIFVAIENYDDSERVPKTRAPRAPNTSVRPCIVPQILDADLI